MIKKLERLGHILRSVPASQLLRRLHIVALRKLEPRILPAVPKEIPALRAELPSPIFKPRVDQWRGEGARAFLDLAWGSREFTLPMDWVPALKTRLDGSWRARLQYMEYLEGADDDWFIKLIEDWLDQVTLERSDMRQFGWRSFNLSIRAVVWLQQIAQRRERLPSQLVQRMCQSLSHQMIYLERFLETDLRGNHLIKNLKAFLWLGRCFDGPLANHWHQLGQRLLAAELSEQTLTDGTHYERSPAYHCQVLADFIECRIVLDKSPLRDQLDDAIVRMSKALRHLVHPDGKVAQFNDGGLTMAYSPSECLEAAAKIQANPIAANATKVSDEGVAKGVFSLKDAGFFGYRMNNNYLIVDCGRLAPDYLIGHGHGDILSFEWSIDGRRIIVDQGTYQNLGGERRAISRATASHNTVCINGLNQGDFYGAHRCGHRPTPELIECSECPNGFVLEGRHNGYRYLKGRPQHRRKLSLVDNQLTICDVIEEGKDQQGVGSFLLHPDCLIAFDEQAIIIENGDLRLRLSANTELQIEDAEWYPDLYCAHPNKRISYKMVCGKPVEFIFKHLN